MNNNFRKFYKKYKSAVLINLFLLVLITLVYINARIEYSKLDKEGVYTVGKFVEYVKHPKTRTYYFEFYLVNEKIKVFEKSAPNGFIIMLENTTR